MCTSAVYQASGIRGYQHQSIRLADDAMQLRIRMKTDRLTCPGCGAPEESSQPTADTFRSAVCVPLILRFRAELFRDHNPALARCIRFHHAPILLLRLPATLPTVPSIRMPRTTHSPCRSRCTRPVFTDICFACRLQVPLNPSHREGSQCAERATPMGEIPRFR